MINYWSPPPSFAAGQYWSASAHGLGMVEDASMLLAGYLAGNTPFTNVSIGSHETDGWHHFLWGYVDGNWLRIWSGAIRHKYDTLAWSIRVGDHVGEHITIRIKYGDSAYTIIDSATPGTFTGTVTLSGATVGETYEIHVDVDASSIGATSYTILHLYEAYTPTLAALASFADGTTPTTAQWQAYSLRASSLYALLTPPVPCFLGGISEPIYGLDDEMAWRGTFTYVGRYMYYHVRLGSPTAEGGIASAIMTVNGSDFTLASLNPPSYWPSPEYKDAGDYDYQFWDFRGTLDLNSLGLTVGNPYEASLRAYIVSGTIPTMKLFAFWPQTQTAPTLAWWSTMTDISQGQAVSVQAVRDNLTALSSRAVYRNIPVARRNPKTSVPFWGQRVYDWLIYRSDKPEGIEEEDPSPSLGYWNGFEWIETPLPYESGKWKRFDLKSQERLWTGVPFRINDCTFAFQDNAP